MEGRPAGGVLLVDGEGLVEEDGDDGGAAAEGCDVEDGEVAVVGVGGWEAVGCGWGGGRR